MLLQKCPNKCVNKKMNKYDNIFEQVQKKTPYRTPEGFYEQQERTLKQAVSHQPSDRYTVNGGMPLQLVPYCSLPSIR